MDISDVPNLEEELKQAKAHPFKVRLEFDRRFRVWHDIIHRNRRLHLASAPTPEELISLHGRYEALDIADAARLKRRALKEFDYATELFIDDNNISATLGHYQILQSRKREIDAQLDYQLSQYERIAEYRIRQRATVREHQLTQLTEG